MGIEKKVYSFRFEKELVDALMKICETQNRNFSNLVETILKEYVSMHTYRKGIDMVIQDLLNAVIYDHSRTHRLLLEKVIREYAENNKIELGTVISTTRTNTILNLSLSGTWLYLLNINDLEKTTDGIKFALEIRNNDSDGSIVFHSEHDIFLTGRSDLAIYSLTNHVIVMSFLAKDSLSYENELKECIAIHVRKISTPKDAR